MANLNNNVNVRANPNYITRKPSTYLHVWVLEEYLTGKDQNEMDTIETSFNQWCSKLINGQAVTGYFAKFMEEVYVDNLINTPVMTIESNVPTGEGQQCNCTNTYKFPEDSRNVCVICGTEWLDEE